MNYFKLRTLVIILILVMISFLFTYIYTNGNFIRMHTDLEMRMQSPGVSPIKVFSQHSHGINIFANTSSPRDRQEFLIANQKHENTNIFAEKHEQDPSEHIPNENDIPIIVGQEVINYNEQNQLKQQTFLQQEEKQQHTSNQLQQHQQNVLEYNKPDKVIQTLHQGQQQVDTDREERQDDAHAINTGNIGQNVANEPPQPVAARPCNRLWSKGKSRWFDERFNGAISSIWTRDNIGQSSDVNNWWLKLQSSKNRDVVGVMESAFRMIPDVDVYKDRSTCRRCAVVGNSGNLRGSKYGSQIDAHDMVIRMNEAPLTNFEEDVGYRETHRLMYPESFYNIKQDVHFVLVSFKTLDIEWLVSAMTTGTIKRTWRPVKNVINVNASLVQIYNPTLMKQVHEVWNKKIGRYPSTGLLAIMFAIHACDEVDVYGYGANKVGNWDHYWQNDAGVSNSAFRKTGVHNSAVETEIYKRLDAEGIITLHMGNAHR